MLDYRTGPIRVDNGRAIIEAMLASVQARFDRRDEGTGRFEFDLPLSAKKVWIEASNDENEDGRPGPRDPSGRYSRNPVTLSADGVAEIRIQLQRQEPPPGGSGAEL